MFYKESLVGNPHVSNKEKQVSKGSDVKKPSKPMLDKGILSIGKKCQKLQDILDGMSSEAKLFEIVLPTKMFNFQEDKPIFINEEDITQLFHLAYLNVPCIQVFMM